MDKFHNLLKNNYKINDDNVSSELLSSFVFLLFFYVYRQRKNYGSLYRRTKKFNIWAMIAMYDIQYNFTNYYYNWANSHHC